MAWFKVDDGFHSSHKLMRIPRVHRLEAAGLWVISGSWSAQEELDGLVPLYMIEEWGASDAAVHWLYECGLWVEESSGAQFANWGEYQPTKAELEENREKERQRKASWREAKAKRDAERKAAEMSQRDNRGTDAGRTDLSRLTRPDPTRPDPTPSESKDSSGGGTGDESPPSPFCKRHEATEGTDEKCRGCGLAYNRYERWVEAQAPTSEPSAHVHRWLGDGSCVGCTEMRDAA